MPWQKRKPKRYKATLVAAAVIGGSTGIFYAWNAASDYIENYHARMSETEALAKLKDVRTNLIPQMHNDLRFSTGAPADDCIDVNFTDGTRAVVYRDDKPAAVAPVTRRFDLCRADMQKEGEELLKNPNDPGLLSTSAVQYRTEADAEKATAIFQRHAEDVVRQAFRTNPKARISVAVDEAASASAWPLPQTEPVPEVAQANAQQTPNPSAGNDEKPVSLRDLARESFPYLLIGFTLLAAWDGLRTKRRPPQNATDRISHLGVYGSLKRPARKLPALPAPTDNTPS